MRSLYKNLFLKGKGLRGQIALTVGGFLDLSKKQKETLAHIVECIHHSSILHDDVIDGSPLRRGQKSSWVRFSMKKSILAGDYLLAQAAQEAARMNNLALMNLTAQTLKKLVMGEWLQDSLKGRETAQGLNQVHELKTGSLFQWCLKAPFLTAGFYDSRLQNSLSRLGRLWGLLFQRADDLLDFNIRNQENKICFTDLADEGFNSFAVFLCRRRGGGFKARLKNCRNLKEVYACVGSEKKFKQQLKAFDQSAQLLILQGAQETARIKSLLKNNIPQPSLLSDELKSRTHHLYWRPCV